MESIIEMGKISSRGQIAIPSSIREQLGLSEGSKVLFFTEDNILMVKKVNTNTFAELTMPLKQAAKRSKLREKDIVDISHTERENN